jgi:hypothetical protein
MSMRKRIASIMRGGTMTMMSYDDIADVITEALPSMIAPLVWKKSKNSRVRTTKMNLGLQYNMQISLSGGAIWSVNTVKGWHNAFDEHEAEGNINNHYRAAIMAAFNGAEK